MVLNYIICETLYHNVADC